MFFIPQNFCSTRASTIENMIFGVLTLNSLISTNIPSQLVPKIWRHAPGHCAWRRPIIGLWWYLNHLRIRHKSSQQKKTPLWKRLHRNHHTMVVYAHQCITASSLICVKKMSQDKYVAVNAAPPERLSNRQSKAIYPSSPIRVNTVSPDKGPDREFTSSGIMTRRTRRLGCHPGKNKSCQQENFS